MYPTFINVCLFSISVFDGATSSAYLLVLSRSRGVCCWSCVG